MEIPQDQRSQKNDLALIRFTLPMFIILSTQLHYFVSSSHNYSIFRNK